jgi:hypothetical protein
MPMSTAKNTTPGNRSRRSRIPRLRKNVFHTRNIGAQRLKAEPIFGELRHA